MTPNEFRSALEVLDLTQVAFANLIDMEPRTARRYAAGMTPIPGAVRILLRLMVARPEVKGLVEEIARQESPREPA